MTRLIDALAGLFTAAAQAAGGQLAKTAGFALENVSWTGELKEHEPLSHPLADTYLELACANSGQRGSHSQLAAQALLEVRDKIKWFAYSADYENEPDMAAFSSNFTATRVIGEGGVLPSNKVKAGFSLQGPDTYYPPHARHAEESYWIIGGNGDWRVDTEPWFAVKPGDTIYHQSRARHAMQTNALPLLAVWLWTSHLGSEVVIVRG